MKWLAEHPWISYLIIYVLMTYVYNKVFKVRKLPLLKELIVYVLIGVGALLLLIFQNDLQLPIVYSLSVAVGLMFIVRFRYFLQGRRANRKH